MKRVLVACALLASCRGRELHEEKPATADLPALADLETHERLLAVSDTGRAFVTRKGDQLTVWSRSGKPLGQVTALGPDEPGYWVGVSSGGHLLAEVAQNDARVVDVASGRAHWNLGEHEAVWGPPVFSPDGRTVVLPMKTSLALYDTANGKSRGTIDNDHLGPAYPLGQAGLWLAREIRFSRDGSRLAVRCGADTESYANHTLFLADIKSKQLTGAILGHATSLYDAQWLADGRILTEDGNGTLRVVRGTTVERTLALGPDAVGPLVASDDLSTVALGGPSAITVWRAGQPLASIPFAQHDTSIEHVELGANQVVAIALDGSVHTFAIPAATGAANAPAWIVPDAAARKREAALYALAPNLWSPAQPVELDLAEDAVHAGFVDDAHDMLATWLEHPRAADQERVKSIGLELARNEGPSEDKKPMIELLYAHWPNDARIVRALVEGISDSDPERAEKVTRQAIARHVLPADELAKLRDAD